MGNFNIDVTPDSQELWESFGKNHKNFTSLLCELIDNSISNLIANESLNKREIKITIENKESHLVDVEDMVKVSIEDTGTGIHDFSQAMDLGKKNRKSESYLNEHGFGLKNALATANKKNNNWKIYSRTKQDFDSELVSIVEAPWKMTFNGKFTGKKEKIKWPGDNNGTGTLIEFVCTKNIFNSISKRGSKFNYKLESLIEEIGVIYRDFIEKHKVKITLSATNNNISTNYDVIGIFPKNASLIEKLSEDGGHFKNDHFFNINNNKLKVYYKFYWQPEKDISGRKPINYYTHNTLSQGVEIRLNGRLLEYNVFEEIWDKKRHDVFNPFFGVINIEGEGKDLPPTSTTKTGFIKDSPIFKELIEQIRKILPKQFYPDNQKPYWKDKIKSKTKNKKKPKESTKQKNAIDLIKKWKNPKNIFPDFKVFSGISQNICILDVQMVNENDEVILIENKRETSKLLDIYQLRMYWDGYVYDNETSPDKAYLVAESHPNWMKEVRDEINRQKDSNGKNYNIELEVWSKIENVS